MDMMSALLALRPNAGWGVSNEDYDKIMNFSNVEMPTREEIYEWIANKKKEEPMRLLRELRNKKLAEYDWQVVRAYSRAEPIDVNLANYLQELRDLPSISAPTLNDKNELDMTSFTMPELKYA